MAPREEGAAFHRTEILNSEAERCVLGTQLAGESWRVFFSADRNQDVKRQVLQEHLGMVAHFSGTKFHARMAT